MRYEGHVTVTAASHPDEWETTVSYGGGTEDMSSHPEQGLRPRRE